MAGRPVTLSAAVRFGLLLVAGTALMTLSAKTQVPFWPVPMTLQTMAVMAFAVLLGPRRATAIFLAYLAAGAAGLPIFAGAPERGVGIAYMVGPTGGFLLGCLVASTLVGELAAGRGWAGRIGAMLAGLVPIYGFGVGWLALFVPADRLIATGVAPFILGELVKIGIVAAAAALAAPFLARLKPRRG